MKRLLCLLLFCVSAFCSMGQTDLKQKTDSVFRMIEKDINEKKADDLYELTGDTFRGSFTREAFKGFCTNNLFPLNNITGSSLEAFDNNLCRYKISFAAIKLTLLLGIDKKNKIETIMFQPYKEPRSAKHQKPQTSNKLITGIDKAVDSAATPYMMMAPTTGLSLAVIMPGNVYYYSYGETAKGDNILPDEHTIFEIGSITKTFTATMLAEASLTGKVRLDDPINKYLPDSIPKLSYDGVPVTLKSMSNHSSGLPALPTNFKPANLNNPYSDYTKQDLMRYFTHIKLTRKPGEKYEYSNLAVGTLGMILADLYHMDYQSLVRREICDPLKMNETRVSIKKADSTRLARGYDEYGAEVPGWDFQVLAGAGSLHSTVFDLVKYVKANMGAAYGLLNRSMQLAHKQTFKDGQSTVAMAWHYIRPGRDSLIFHNGGTGGYRSYLAFDDQKKFAVVVLSNTAIGTEDIGNQIMSWLEEKYK